MNRILIRYIGFSLVAAVLMLAGSSVLAQGSDGQYVIKVRGNGHYLAHLRNSNGDYVLGDLNSFSPECLWYSGIEFNISGTNHNYYFYDTVTEKYRYITAPMRPNGTLGLSDDMPATYLLSNTDTIYYFYDWDSEANGDGGGLARGHQFSSINTQQNCSDCGHVWGDDQCWDVYWIAYKEGDGWKTSPNCYDIDGLSGGVIGGRFHSVGVEFHPKVVSGVSQGALATLSNWEPTEPSSVLYSVNATPYTYTFVPEYNTYTFREMETDSSFSNHSYHYSGNQQVTPPLDQQTATAIAPKSYEWSLTGDAAEFLSFASSSSPVVHTLNGNISGTSPDLSATVYYVESNRTGTKTATLKLVVTYADGSTQERTATITLTTECQNPPQSIAPIVNYEDVLVEWYDIADSYKVYWRIKTPSNNGPWSYSDAVTDNFYAFVGLEPDKQYEYKVHAFCSGVEVTDHDTLVYTFRTRDEHELLVYGAIFGGGRMANVTGKTEVVVVNCDSIGAIYGGNDIAGAVLGNEGNDGANITLGVNEGDDYASYGTTSGTLRIGSVYGGGNGYYAYNQPSGSVSFTPIQAGNISVTVAPDNMVIGYNVLENQWANVVWTNSGTSAVTLTVPSITKTAINVVNDYVKVDTIFGGAKNAFITANTDTVSAITINGGTIVSVFGGNNVGGSQGTGKHYIKVDEASNATTNYLTRIHTLFGGGNKVAGSETDILVNGGMIDTLYAGGNSADVAAAKVEVNCALAGGSGENTFGHVYSSAIESFSDGVIKIKNNYPWNGTGVYNITALFGGNNQADMEVVPTITLTSGSVGTVYGGGNAGDMNGGVDDPRDIANDFGPMVFYNDIDDPNDNDTIIRKYSTHVKLDKPNVLVDYLYGGCQMSNVYYSAWVEVSDGHVGTVYGGCNISGDVGSNYFCDTASGYLPSGLDGPWNLGPRNERYQAVKGATFVKVSGGIIYQDLFAGSNGRYHCNNGKLYIEGINFDNLDTEGRYIGLTVPTHNETHAIVSGTAVVKGNVYAGGNLASVGFIRETVIPSNNCPRFVGLATVRMSGGHVHGSVFGGGNMASIWGSNAVSVQGGSIDGALYGGNDRIGLVAQITNRVLPPDYGKASDGYTPLDEVRTYISLTGRPLVNTVYGGGNGDYDYSIGQYCNPNDEPVQSNTFVDVNIDGYAVDTLKPGHINTVYGGGNGVTVTGTTTVFLNVKGDPNNQGAVAQGDHVDFIFGGNNKGPLAIVPEIILLKGQVNTVYGGCNQGAMVGAKTFTFGGNTYNNIGSMVHLLNEYPTASDPMTPTATVSHAVYGGCRMNGVTNNSLVLVEGGYYGDTVGFFGGSDISGIVSGTSRVVVKEGTHNNGPVIGNAFGGGNGNYDYVGHNVYVAGSDYTDPNNLITTSEANLTRPACEYTQIDMMGGTAGNLYGGGNAAGVSHTSTVNMNGGNVTAGIYGGCCSMDTIHGDVAVNVLGGTVGTNATTRADIFGGGYGKNTRTDGNVEVNISRETGTNPPEAPTIFGDVYGGSALGHVNDTMVGSVSAHTTTVNILNGTITGDIYGGGLGQKSGVNGATSDIAALVNGKTYVNIGAYDNNSYSGNVTFNTYGGSTNDSLGGRVYGANNVYGTPLDSVFVNIYQTAHGETPQLNHYPTTVPSGGWNVNTLATNAGSQAYAIRAVYGGGNLANYTPNANADTESPRRSATVHVYQCKENTVEDVFGGGNAADVGTAEKMADTYVKIEGGRIHRVIGGGNGEKLSLPAANIYGAANTTVYAGLIDEVYGGANMQGSVDAINLTMSNPNHSSLSTCGDQVYGSVFGCANAADYNRSVTTNILCGVGEIGELYGGSNLANIGTAGQFNADVTLNLYGGKYSQVFAGSKGDTITLGTGHVNKASNIYGNVTLNLFGGKVTDAYGGSNYNGNIAGTITVNVLDVVNTGCTYGSLDVTNVFGASNMADYKPTYTPASGDERISPVVNVMHIAQTLGIRTNVYGGGNKAIVKASPQVNIGYDETTMASILTACGYTQPTGFPRAYVSGNVFGGGNEAGVTGNPVINMRDNGTVVTGIYGGCNTKGNVNGDINVNIYGGTLGTSGAPMTDGIFGGGKGYSTETDGNITVTIGEGTNPTVYADVYGGSAFGEVGAAGKLAKVDLKAGTIHGKIFGGGKGDDTYAAEVTGNTQLAIAGTVTDSIFGGCNVNGIVKGDATVGITDGTMGVAATGTSGQPGYVPEVRANVYGGGLGQNTKVKGNVAVTVDNASGDVYGDVYGGSAKGLVNCNDAGTAQNNYSKTSVTLADGTIHGSIYGGGHGLEDQAANVYGPVTVNVNGGTVTNVFGCNNVKGAPMDSVVLNVTGGIIDSIFGGGNVAAYVAPANARNYPEMNISGGTIRYKVVGGGNNIASGGVSGNPHVNISGGTLCTGATKAGVYGGCNTNGVVNGDIFVTITGDDDDTHPHHTQIGTDDQLHAGTPISVHGGGYGAGTSTLGSITVTFGADEGGESSEHCEWPMLYGDLYGGSALGHVNTAYGTDSTNVNVLNGSVKNYQLNSQSPQYGGNIYGGGLGDANHQATVNGKVHVNIGGVSDGGNELGQASLKNCNVYGCNNANGSPKSDVYVDVYQTHHIEKDSVNYYEANDREYAIKNVFGGGNNADYSPRFVSNRAHNYIHFCDNTIERVYGGGNAADALGVDVNVDGGRFEFIFGGGNGQVIPANIGEGGINLTVCSGRVGYKYVGCDARGYVLGAMHDMECDQETKVCEGDLTVEYFFFGANMATIIGGLRDTIFCTSSDSENHMHYQNVYAGSRWAVIYGDIYLLVQGGEIMNLFGGSMGSEANPGHVRRFPDPISDPDHYLDDVPADAKEEMRLYLQEHDTVYGKGGNIYMILEGGTIHNVFGGNQLYGNVDGDIIIKVDSKGLDCPLVIDTIYGGNEKAIYHPYAYDNGDTRISPKVYVKNGTVRYDVYGGSLGNLTDNPSTFIADGGRITSKPYVVIGSDNVNDTVTIGRDVFGGGSKGKVIGDAEVVIRGTSTINGNVFGGARESDVVGNTNVNIAPTSPITEIEIPTPPEPRKRTLTLAMTPNNTYGSVIVTDNYGNVVARIGTTEPDINEVRVAEGSMLHIKAVPAEGKSFVEWHATHGVVISSTSLETSFIMGTQDTTLTAEFE